MAPHPYYPRDLVIPNFEPQTWSREQLLGIFGSVLVGISAVAWILGGS